MSSFLVSRILVWALALSILFFTLQAARKVYLATRSPLSKIPSPWYAALTTIHLNYGFATGKIWKTVESAHRKYGSIVRLGPRQVWISDKESIKKILSTIDLPKVAMYAEIARDRQNPGLFGEIRPVAHKKLKRFLSPAFTVAYTENLDHLFGSCAYDLIQKYQSLLTMDFSVEVDIVNDLHNVALDIMGECSLGKGFGYTNPNNKIGDNIEEQVWKSIPTAVFEGLARRYQTVYIKRFLRAIGLNFEFDWPAQMISAMDRIVRGRMENSVTGRPDLLQHMIDKGTNPVDNTHLSTRQVLDQMSELLLAGSETTAGTISCLILELVRNPDVKAKLLASLPVRGRDDSVLGSREIRTGEQFRYLNACIKENLRLHPVASEMGRRTGNRWVNLMGYDLPPHTVISASYRELHRDGRYWPQPLRFWPERWLEADERGDAPRADVGAYFPFSAGTHSCIGINFAWAEMRIVAANLLSNFDIEEVPGQIVDFRQFITMQFRTGSWKVRIRSRSEKVELATPGVAAI